MSLLDRLSGRRRGAAARVGRALPGERHREFDVAPARGAPGGSTAADGSGNSGGAAAGDGAPTAAGTPTAAVALGADAAAAGTGLTGAGVTVGIISDSFDALGTAAADEADGALPARVDVLRDGASGRDEGRAMAEVAHGVAPGAGIAFSAADGSVAGLAAAIAALRAAGCTVICDDVTYADEPFFQMGDAAEKAISAFTAAGGVYFTAASNAGPDSAEQATFSGMAATLGGIGAVEAANFGTAAAPRATEALNLVAGRLTSIDLQWAQPWASVDGAGSAYSLAVAIYDPGGTLVRTFDADQVGGDPVQSGSFTPATSGAYTVAVYVDGGTDPGGTFKVVANDDCATPASFAGASGSGSVIGHNMDPDAVTVGAVAARDAPADGSGLASEPFGAAGPGEELYSDAGAALADGKTLHAVDVSGPDGVATTLPASDLDPFYGTSCATPAVAAVGALMKEADPSLDAGEIRTDLQASAIPFGSADQSGAGLVQAPAAVALAEESNTAIHDDFFGNGQSALLWRSGGGDLEVSEVDDDAVLGTSPLSGPAGPGWSPVATGDFSGAPGHADILWRNADGRLLVEGMDGASVQSRTDVGDPGAQWSVVGAGAFSRDGDSDVLLADKAGDGDILTMDGASVRSRTAVAGPGAGWTAAGIGDFDGDGQSDILWRNASGALAAWIMHGTSVASELQLPATPGPDWTVAGTGDLTGDGHADILLADAATGGLDLLAMAGTGVASQTTLTGGPGAGWQAAGVGDFDGSGRAGILFEDAATGAAAIADVSHARVGRLTPIATPGAGWTASPA